MTRVTATCHCGAVVVGATLVDGLRTARRCNCSYCSRRGAVMVSAAASDIAVEKGRDVLRTYQWGTATAEHHFCGICGIYTHHRRRSNPNEYGINVACIADVRIDDLGEVAWVDGRSTAPD